MSLLSQLWSVTRVTQYIELLYSIISAFIVIQFPIVHWIVYLRSGGLFSLSLSLSLLYWHLLSTSCLLIYLRDRGSQLVCDNQRKRTCSSEEKLISKYTSIGETEQTVFYLVLYKYKEIFIYSSFSYKLILTWKRAKVNWAKKKGEQQQQLGEELSDFFVTASKSVIWLGVEVCCDFRMEFITVPSPQLIFTNSSKTFVLIVDHFHGRGPRNIGWYLLRVISKRQKQNWSNPTSFLL